MRARQGVDGELYLKQHFYELNGRVFQPYGEERKVYFAYAQPKGIVGSDERYEELKKYFVINECKMGEDPKVVLEEKINKDKIAKKSISNCLYFLSSIDTYVNDNKKDILDGKATDFYSGYGALLSGVDFKKVEYFLPEDSHKVRGVYVVESVNICDKSTDLNKAKKSGSYGGFEKPYRVHFVLGAYKELESDFTYGIDKNAAKGVALSVEEFKEYCRIASEK